MSNTDIGLQKDILEKIENITRRQNDYERRLQLNCLYSSYQNYALRNSIILERLRKDLARDDRKIRIAYYVYLLDQLSYPQIAAFQNDERFDLLLLTHTPEQAEYLEQLGYEASVVHGQWENFPDYKPKSIDYTPDICFSEMPYGIFPQQEDIIRPWMIAGGWLPKYKDIFTQDSLNNALFCFIPYAFLLSNQFTWLNADPTLHFYYGLPYPNFSWKFFVESQAHKEFAMRTNTAGNNSNYVVSGYSKYDYYFQENKEASDFSWRYDTKERKRIVYAPHFYRSNAFLAQTCELLLELADSGKYEIVFKPHPNHNSIVNQYLPMFQNHPSTQVVRHSSNSQYLFATSDLNIISSVSMHADALFCLRPFISELPETNFNEFGLEVQAAGYRSDSKENMKLLIDQLLERGEDPKANQRRALREKFSPHNGASAKAVIAEILRDLGRS